MKNKGITLIALVITIIVLLILSAVGIAMITGENGILSKAKTAKENSDSSSVEESNRLGEYNQSMESYTTSRSTLQTENFKSDGTEIALNKTYDGKQVYAATITGTLTSGTGMVFKDLTSYNLQEIIDIYGHYLADSNYSYIAINTYFSSSAYLSYWYNIPSHKLYYNCGTQYNGATAYVTVEYTKAN